MDPPDDLHGFTSQRSKRAGETFPGTDKRIRNTRNDYTQVAPHRNYGNLQADQSGDHQQNAAANVPVHQQYFSHEHFAPPPTGPMLIELGHYFDEYGVLQIGSFPVKLQGPSASYNDRPPPANAYMTSQQNPLGTYGTPQTGSYPVQQQGSSTSYNGQPASNFPPQEQIRSAGSKMPSVDPPIAYHENLAASSALHSNSTQMASTYPQAFLTTGHPRGRLPVSSAVNGEKTTSHPIAPAAHNVRPSNLMSRRHGSGAVRKVAEVPPPATRQQRTPATQSNRRHGPTTGRTPMRNRAPVPAQGRVQLQSLPYPPQLRVTWSSHDETMGQLRNPFTYVPGIARDKTMPKPEERNPILPYDVLLARHLQPRQRYLMYAEYHSIYAALYRGLRWGNETSETALRRMSWEIQHDEWRYNSKFGTKQLFTEMTEAHTRPYPLEALNLDHKVAPIPLLKRDSVNVSNFADTTDHAPTSSTVVGPPVAAEKIQVPRVGPPMGVGPGQTLSAQIGFGPSQQSLGTLPIIKNADNPIVIDDDDDESTPAAVVHRSDGLNPAVKRLSTAAPSRSPKRARGDSYSGDDHPVVMGSGAPRTGSLQTGPLDSAFSGGNAAVEALPQASTKSAAHTEATTPVQAPASGQTTTSEQAVSPAQPPSAGQKSAAAQEPRPIPEDPPAMKRWMEDWTEKKRLVEGKKPGEVDNDLRPAYNRGVYNYKNARLAYTYCKVSEEMHAKKVKEEEERKRETKSARRKREANEKAMKQRERLELPEPKPVTHNGQAGSRDSSGQGVQEVEPHRGLSQAVVDASENTPGDAKAEGAGVKKASKKQKARRSSPKQTVKATQPKVPQEHTPQPAPARVSAPAPVPEPIPAVTLQDADASLTTKEDEVVPASPALSRLNDLEDWDTMMKRDAETIGKIFPVGDADEATADPFPEPNAGESPPMSEQDKMDLFGEYYVPPDNVAAQPPPADEAIVEPSPPSTSKVDTHPSTSVEQDDLDDLFEESDDEPDTPPTSKDKTQETPRDEPAPVPVVQASMPPPVVESPRIVAPDPEGTIYFTADGDHEASKYESEYESDDDVDPEVEEKFRQIIALDIELHNNREKFDAATNLLFKRRLQEAFDKLMKQRQAIENELAESSGL